MKKLLGLFAVIALIMGMTISASAAPVAITFDEPGINLGDTITNQYASRGVNWIKKPFQDAPLENEVAIGTGDGRITTKEFPSDGQFLDYGGSTVEGVIALDFSAASFSFQYRRPDSSGEISVRLYSDYIEVCDPFDFTWAITNPNLNSDGWGTFLYDGPAFDLIWMYSPTNKKFAVDNLEINPVPVPASVWLLASGLVPVIYRRIKK